MPLGKYYCDYCDKEFQDTAAARRKHLQGVVHQRAKGQWYDTVRSSSSPGLNQFPDPHSIGNAGVCNRFVRTVWQKTFELFCRGSQSNMFSLYAFNVHSFPIMIPEYGYILKIPEHDQTDFELLGNKNSYFSTLNVQGSCQYGDSCRYYHPKQNTPGLNTQAMEAKGFVDSQSQGVTGSLLQGEAFLPVMFGNQLGSTSLGNLPPSLWPPPEGGYPTLPFVDWG